MALELLNTVEVIEMMENYIERIRPPQHIREELDIGYKIENQSIILFEIRPSFFKREVIIESPYAKATYVKSKAKWKVYWMRGNLKWTLYDVKKEVNSLVKFLDLVDEDKYHCFKG